jgi:hypothetical protein
VAAATSHLQWLGYHVEDVGATESYDLDCSKEKDELHVEVKGTTTDGLAVLLTPNEVARNEQQPCRSLSVREHLGHDA